MKRECALTGVEFEGGGVVWNMADGGQPLFVSPAAVARLRELVTRERERDNDGAAAPARRSRKATTSGASGE